MDPARALDLSVTERQKPMNAVIDRGDSPIQLFYQETTIFVTGGTGFLGKQLIEKLLRACQIKKIYLLMRHKKGKSPQDRLTMIIQDPVFDLVRQKQPKFEDKIVLVEGEVSQHRLGLSEVDWSKITNEVDIIFHAAATVRFDEPLKVAAAINVKGTMEVLELAKKCEKLKQFVHISTAYSQATEWRVGKEVLEQFYPTPMEPEVLLQLVNTLDEEKLEDITPILTRGWPNTYTFTKAIAEEVVRSTAADLPICVVKPPIVSPTYYEPTPGWLDLGGLTGPSGIILGIGLGVLHVFFVDVDKRLASVPLDYVNNAIIGAAWDSAERRKSGDKEIPVYIVANEESLVKWGFYSKIFRTDGRGIATNMALWYNYLIETTSVPMYWILTILLHYIPAYILDGVCSVTGKWPKDIKSFVKIFQKINKRTALYNYFVTQEWLFRDKNVKTMIARMTPNDKAIFNCDITSIDFREYTLVWCIGIRKFILKDGLKNTLAAIRKQKILKVVNIVFLVIYFYILWSFSRIFLYVLKNMFLFMFY